MKSKKKKIPIQILSETTYFGVGMVVHDFVSGTRMVYDRALTEEEKAAIEKYLYEKHGYDEN